MLPTFIHAGAAKAKSTWLWRVCQEHPQVFVHGKPDNVNFFLVHYRYFPRDQVLVMLHDDLVADEAVFLGRFFSFIGVDPAFRSSARPNEINPDSPSADLATGLTPELRAEFKAACREDVLELQDLIGRDLSAWLRP